MQIMQSQPLDLFLSNLNFSPFIKWFFFFRKPLQKNLIVWQANLFEAAKKVHIRKQKKWHVNYISSVMLESERAVTERLVILTLLEGLALIVGVVLTCLVEFLQEGQVGGIPRPQAFLVQQCQDTDVRLKTESHTDYLE